MLAKQYLSRIEFAQAKIYGNFLYEISVLYLDATFLKQKVSHIIVFYIKNIILSTFNYIYFSISTVLQNILIYINGIIFLCDKSSTDHTVYIKSITDHTSYTESITYHTFLNHRSYFNVQKVSQTRISHHILYTKSITYYTFCAKGIADHNFLYQYHNIYFSIPKISQIILFILKYHISNFPVPKVPQIINFYTKKIIYHTFLFFFIMKAIGNIIIKYLSTIYQWENITS